MQNVAILVEEWPDPDVVEEITGCRDELIYGLFSGTPLSEQHIEDSGVLPPVIAIYQGPLVEDFPELDELIAEIEITLVHEIAHFMGLDEEAVRALRLRPAFVACRRENVRADKSNAPLLFVSFFHFTLPDIC